MSAYKVTASLASAILLCCLMACHVTDAAKEVDVGARTMVSVPEPV